MDARLFKAVAKEAHEAVIAAVDAKAVNWTATNRTGDTILHAAARQGNDRILKALLHGAPPTIDPLNRDGETPLLVAIDTGVDIEAVKCILDKKPDLGLRGGDMQHTPLHAAAAANFVHVVEALLQHDAPLDALGASRETALHAAVEANAENAASVLIDRGTDLNARNVDGETPLHLVVHASLPNLALEMLRRQGKGALDVAACVDRDGNSPLHVAMQEGRSTIADILVRFGFDPKLKNRKGNTPDDEKEARNTRQMEALAGQRDAREAHVRQRAAAKAEERRSTEVSQFLEAHGCESLIDLLHSKRWRLLDDAFLGLQELDLIKLGVKDPEVRERLLRAFEEHREEERLTALAEERRQAEAIAGEMRRQRIRAAAAALTVCAVVYAILRLVIQYRLARSEN